MLKYIFSVKLDQVHSSLRGEREKSPKRVCLVIRLERSYYSSSHDSGLDMRASGLGCSSAGPAVVSWVLFAGLTVLWILGRNKWKKSEAYLNYQTMINTIKAEKKAK